MYKKQFLLLAAALALVVTLPAQTGWPCYGGDAGGARYSALTQINDKNVHELKPAWTFHTGELELYQGTDALSKAAFEATPITIGDKLFFSTPSCRVFALDAETGKQLWLYDPKVNLHEGYSEITSRGVSAWIPQDKNQGARIFIGTIDGRMIALNAENGKPISSFDNKGTVDLRKGYGDDISITSPPAVIGNLVITGCSLGDNQRSDYPRGVVRAFSAITGKQVWQWDPLAFDSTHKSGAANAWSIISVDAERGLVFIPTSSPSPDYYGGNRKGDNLYANSLVALHARSGKLAWSFQVVHHDIWDNDIAAQPVLANIKRNDSIVPAVAIGTKMGHIFVLNRETGKPVFPVEERAVPASDLPGEMASPTQPFPVLPEPLGLQRITENDAWGTTPEAKKAAAARIAQYRNHGPFTPPSFQGSLMTPGNVGGINWSGMCFNPSTNTLFTNINRLAAIVQIFPREQLKQAEEEDKELLRKETGRQEGTPYVMKRDYLFTIQDGGLVMQSAPPWGTLHAIDLVSGKENWEVPVGYMMDTTKYPDAKKWGSLSFGGAITTAGNILFVAGTRDNHLRAFQSSTGKLLWEYLLPASAQATPMTYSVNGKQFVVIAAGGHGKFMTKQGDAVVAFARQ